MDFAILRVEKLKTMGNISASLSHNYRLRPTPNADPSKTVNNEHDLKTARQVLDGLKNRLPEKTRKNAVLAIEYLITASPDWNGWKNKDKDSEFFEKAKQWLIKKHGAENVISTTIHRDETTPHMAVYVVPIDSKGSLNCREFLGGKGKLSEIQTSFHNEVKHLGLSRGIEGSKAEHQPMQKRYAELQKPDEKYLIEKPILKTVTYNDSTIHALDAKSLKNEKLQKYFGSFFEEQHKYYQSQSLKAQESLSVKLSDQTSKTEQVENAHKNAVKQIKKLETKIDELLNEFSQIIEFKQLFPDNYKEMEEGLRCKINNHKNELVRHQEEDARLEAQFRANCERHERGLEQERARELQNTLQNDRKAQIEADRATLTSKVGECATEPEKLACMAIQRKLAEVVSDGFNYVDLVVNNEPNSNPFASLLRLMDEMSEAYDFKQKLDIVLTQCEVSKAKNYDDTFRGWGVQPSFYDNFNSSTKYIVAIQSIIDEQVQENGASEYKMATEVKVALSEVLVGKCKNEYEVLLSDEKSKEKQRKYNEYVELSNKNKIDNGLYFKETKSKGNDFEA